MRLPIAIDGVDFTPYTNKNAYRVSYEKREGANSGVMLDGSKSFDLLANKAKIEWELNALTSAQLSAVLTACLKQYVTVTYFDTLTNAERTAEFIPDVGRQDYAFSRHDLYFFKDGITITLEER